MRTSLFGQLSVTFLAVSVLAGCSGEQQWNPEPSVRLAHDARKSLQEIRTSGSNPEVGWSGRLIERNGCIGLDMEGDITVAVFFSDAEVVRDSDSDALGVRIDPATVLRLDHPYHGSQGPIENSALTQFVDAAECAEVLDTTTGTLVFTAVEGEESPAPRG